RQKPALQLEIDNADLAADLPVNPQVVRFGRLSRETGDRNGEIQASARSSTTGQDTATAREKPFPMLRTPHLSQKGLSPLRPRRRAAHNRRGNVDSRAPRRAGKSRLAHRRWRRRAPVIRLSEGFPQTTLQLCLTPGLLLHSGTPARISAPESNLPARTRPPP